MQLHFVKGDKRKHINKTNKNMSINNNHGLRKIKSET